MFDVDEDGGGEPFSLGSRYPIGLGSTVCSSGTRRTSGMIFPTGGWGRLVVCCSKGVTGVLTKGLLCVRGCQTDATGVVVAVPVITDVAAVSVTFLGASTLATLVDVATAAIGGLLELLDDGGGAGGFFDF